MTPFVPRLVPHARLGGAGLVATTSPSRASRPRLFAATDVLDVDGFAGDSGPMFGDGRAGSGFAIWMFAAELFAGVVSQGGGRWQGCLLRARPVAGKVPLPWFWPVRLRGRRVSVTRSVCRPAQRLATSLQQTETAPDVAALLRRLLHAAVVGFSRAAHARVTWAAVASLGLLADRGTAALRVALASRDVDRACEGNPDGAVPDLVR